MRKKAMEALVTVPPWPTSWTYFTRMQPQRMQIRSTPRPIRHAASQGVRHMREHQIEPWSSPWMIWTKGRANTKASSPNLNRRRSNSKMTTSFGRGMCRIRVGKVPVRVSEAIRGRSARRRRKRATTPTLSTSRRSRMLITSCPRWIQTYTSSFWIHSYLEQTARRQFSIRYHHAQVKSSFWCAETGRDWTSCHQYFSWW